MEELVAILSTVLIALCFGVVFYCSNRNLRSVPPDTSFAIFSKPTGLLVSWVDGQIGFHAFPKRYAIEEITGKGCYKVIEGSLRDYDIPLEFKAVMYAPESFRYYLLCFGDRAWGLIEGFMAKCLVQAYKDAELAPDLLSLRVCNGLASRVKGELWPQTDTFSVYRIKADALTLIPDQTASAGTILQSSPSVTADVVASAAQTLDPMSQPSS